MNKLEKILAQSVTPEMVAEQLIEQEIEEVIEEYETKIANAEDDIEVAKEREQMMRERAERSYKRAEDWKHVISQETEQVTELRTIVRKLKQALEAKHQKNSILTPNEQRAKLIEEAKEYINENKHTLEVTVSREDNKVTVHDYGTTKKSYLYPQKLVWNKYIVKAYAIAKYVMDHNLVNKYTFDAPQPMEIVEGMDVELFNKYRKKYTSGRVVRYFHQDALYLAGDTSFGFSDTKTDGYIHYITHDSYKITGDTKAKYKEEDK